MSAETWTRLLSFDRLGAPHSAADVARSDAPRTDFQRDHDRIVFSTAFRRLHDKTQVFPLPDNDLVHSRLTHSLEVSCVGRSMGTMAGGVILERHPSLAASGLSARSFGDIVAAACLAHDIGNPPFGHAGEDAIGSWFVAHPETTSGLTPAERYDLEKFEGNAQGFRIVTRLQIPKNPGLQLTLATLAAFTKYPREAGPRPVGGGVAAKKHGFFQAEQDAFRAVAAGVGVAPRRYELEKGALEGWARHPLAFLVEAADDICYSILDIEDGFRLGLVDFADVHRLLSEIAAHDPKYRPAEPATDRDERKEQIAYLRAKAINRLAHEVVAAFLDREGDLVAGDVDAPLSEQIPSAQSLDALTAFARASCYDSQGVLEIELAGYNVLHSLLDRLVPAVLSEARSKEEDKLLTVVPVAPTEDTPPYLRLLRVTDYLSGMTDSYAVKVFRLLTGMSLPYR